MRTRYLYGVLRHVFRAIRVLCLTLTALSASAFAHAQARESAASIGVAVGPGQTWDDEGSLGSGFVIGARADRRLFGGTRIELSLDALTHDRDAGYFLANGTTTLFTAALVQRFGSGTIQPYLLAGALVARHSGTVTFGDEPERRERSTNPGYALGSGFIVSVRDRWEVGPEVRALAMQPDDDSNPALAYWVGVRASYRF